MKIRELRLKSNNLEKMARFYCEDLGLRTVLHKNWIDVEVGNSNLIFEFSYKATPYHFAFNIPSNQIEAAHTWLKSRVSLLPYNAQEIVDFSDWNAQAVYFYDPDKNIVEFIARKNLDINAEGAFEPGQLLGISEIGIAVTDVQKTYEHINLLGNSPVYDGNFERFCAAGDEEGLFIIIDRQNKKWIPTNDTAYASPFVMKGSVNLRFSRGLISQH